MAGSGAIPFLSRLLRQTDQGIDAQAATAHAAATLWSLCVDMEHIKPLIAQDETLVALLALLKSPESFVRGQACGCVGEVCIGERPKPQSGCVGASGRELLLDGLPKP